MNKAKYLIAGVVMAALSLTFLVTCRSGGVADSEEGFEVWTCGMHPQVRSDEPGDCPICGMDLIPLAEDADTSDARAPRMVELSQTGINLAKVATAEVAKKELFRAITTTGMVEFDERSLETVSARFAGRIERLYVNYEGAVVSAGSPLAEIYSPQLAAAQQEYLSALTSLSALPAQAQERTIVDARALVNASRERLRLWGITESQIAELERTSSPQYTMTVLAPQSGTVVSQKATVGSYVQAGQPLFEIGNPTRVWIQAILYEQDIPSVKVGQHAVFSVPGAQGEEFRGKVTFIAPVLDPATRSVKARIQPEKITPAIKPGMYVDVEIHHPVGRVLAVPRDAVIDTGEEYLVYVDAGQGMFIAREVKLGTPAGGYYQITEGLKEGEKVVARGGFLLDSETRITGGSSSLYGGASEVDQESPDHLHQP